jgi:hypothetical protein
MTGMACLGSLVNAQFVRRRGLKDRPGLLYLQGRTVRHHDMKQNTEIEAN